MEPRMEWTVGLLFLATRGSYGTGTTQLVLYPTSVQCQSE
jgi:hypothetical protein